MPSRPRSRAARQRARQPAACRQAGQRSSWASRPSWCSPFVDPSNRPTIMSPRWPRSIQPRGLATPLSPTRSAPPPAATPALGRCAGRPVGQDRRGGPPAGSTPARSPAARGTCWSTPWGCCWCAWSMPPRSRPAGRGLAAAQGRFPLLKVGPMAVMPTTLTLAWSTGPRAGWPGAGQCGGRPGSGALRCCRAAGWWSAPCGLGRSRRLARDYERKPEHAEAMIKVAMIR